MKVLKKTRISVLNNSLLLTFTLLLFIYRTAVPIFKYPFVILYILSIVIYFYAEFYKLKSSLIKFSKDFIWIVLLYTILILAFIFSNKVYLIIFKDISNILIILSIFFFLNSSIREKKRLTFFLDNIVYISIFFAIFISITSLYGLFNAPLTSYYSAKDAAKIDSNFALIPLFIGILGILYLIINKGIFFNQLVSNFSLFVITLGILVSGSRRGIILLLLIILFLGIAFIISIVRQKNIISKLGKKTSSFFLILLLFFGILYTFIFHTSGSFKTETLRAFGTPDIIGTKKSISSKVSKIIYFLSYSELNEILWTPIFDPKDPESGWGTRIHKTIFPLTGKNSEIIPKGAKGYLMDSTCNASLQRGNAYSHTRIGYDSVIVGDHIQASVYCFVSKDFNGTWVRLSSERPTYGKVNCFYDLKKKGTWQKLNINPHCKNGKAPVYLYFAKYGVTDFSTLKGHVIFAYPQYKVIKKDSLINELDTSIIKEQSHINVKNDYINQQFHQINFKDKFNYQKAGILDFKALNNRLIYQNEDKDPIRNWIAKIVAEDTTYNPYHADLKVDSIADNFIAPRTVRWQFAWQIFTKEYNWAEKIFGGGFDFLNWYGYYFLKDKTKSDWPHNPFLSVLLYSGILGLLLYLFFLYRVFYLYIKYIKEYYLLFIFFLICFYFSFFSAGHPFDPPVTGFFAMLPFLIHAVHKKEKEKNNGQ